MFLGSCPSGIRTFTGIILGSVAFRGQCHEEPQGMLQHEELGGEGAAMGVHSQLVNQTALRVAVGRCPLGPKEPMCRACRAPGHNLRAKKTRTEIPVSRPAHASCLSSTPLPPRQVALGSGGGTEFFDGPRRLPAASFGRLGGERGRGADWAVQGEGGL